MEKVKDFYQKNRSAITFLLRASGIYFIWYIVYNFWLYPNGTANIYLIHHLIRSAAFVLKLSGFSIFTTDRLIGITGSTGLMVGIACNGLSLFALYAGFILAYPGKLKLKFLFIPVGIFIIDLLNIIRITLLVVIAKYSPGSLQFNHSYTFTLIMYLIIFFMWLFWIRNGNGTSGQKSENG